MSKFDVESYNRTFSSFSGADIMATFAGRAIGELQMIRYVINREKAPIYTMGSPDPRAFSRGKRSIQGNLVFAQFDRDSLIEEMAKEYKGAPNMSRIQQRRVNMAGRGASGDMGLEDQILSGLKSTDGDGGDTYGIATWDEKMTQLGYQVTDDTGISGNSDIGTLDYYKPEYADQILPFNITLSMANEQGARATMEIYGVELLQESSSFSIDDVLTAKAYTFIARKIRGVRSRSNRMMTGESSPSFGEFM